MAGCNYISSDCAAKDLRHLSLESVDEANIRKRKVSMKCVFATFVYNTDLTKLSFTCRGILAPEELLASGQERHCKRR